MLKKEVKEAFNKKIYLLGKDEDGIKYWLEEGKWECDWYWGLGYVETYTNNANPEKAKDISSHLHFDSMFLEGPEACYYMFEKFFKESPLTNSEIWVLLESMQTLYTMRRYSDMLSTKGSHITTNPIAEQIPSQLEFDRINKELIPNLLKKVYDLLSK